ncbi:MAG TPA: UDP-N-acetylmuramoyl-L-alanyl-D-glutamate--2,6-diaminopimelate ligase [Clostridiales bacterium]|nr:UDP-N-acetylmuramoyl-L-alanyl-D-glutamate--2,6-diaminopimelate ligase [Clostridiales bacterium]
MKLHELIEGLNPNVISGDCDLDIRDIVYDSRKAGKNSLFVCIDGSVVDGHAFIPEAIENGAGALLVEKEVNVPPNITVIKVKDTRYGLAFVSDKIYDHPSRKLNLIGITGTKGKTTTTYMIKHILEDAGLKTGLIGTIQNMIGDEVLYAERTTPESYDLQALFSEMCEKDVKSVVMEVSSQGLQLNRVSCSHFEIGVFTNLYKDHISPTEHKDMEEYLNAKIKLFKMCEKGLVNIDSPYAAKVLAEAECPIYTFGIENDCDIRAYDIIKHPHSVEFQVCSPWVNGHILVNIPGKFSVYNALAAIGVCCLSGVSFDNIKNGLKSISVPGRAETIHTGRNFTVIVDYAHTADSLENILSTVKDFSKGRVVSIFGCGGNKDKGRRFGMGEVSGKIADFTVITSDNPRSEDPAAIINDIETGIKKTEGKYIKIVDRREAIRYAIESAKPEDIIVIAGKGHETYQIFKDKTIHFDDREVVREILSETASEKSEEIVLQKE